MQTCALGGLEGALARHAGHTFRALPGDAQAALGEVLALLSVIHPDSDAVTARRALWSALPANSAARVLVEAFVHAHLFVGGPGVAVAHEALLRQWPRAAEWIHETAACGRRASGCSRPRNGGPPKAGAPITCSTAAAP